MTNGSDHDHDREPSDAALSDAVLAALGDGDDGEDIDHDAYQQALHAIAEAHRFGRVLVGWAGCLACAHVNGTAAFPDPAGVPPRVLTHARGLVNAARPTNPSLDPLEKRIVRILRELDDAELWRLFDLMAYRTSRIATACGGMPRLRHVTAFVLECVDRAVERAPSARDRYEPAVGPVGLAVAAIANGHLDTANDYLAACHGYLQLEQPLGVLLAIGTYLLPNATGPLLELDADGHPQAIHPGDRNDPKTDPRTLPITYARDLIHAIQTGNKPAVNSLVAEINTMGRGDLPVMCWHLAVTLGYRIGQLDATSQQPRPT